MRFFNCVDVGRNIYSRFKANKNAYKQYKTILRDWNKQLNETACTKVDILKTPKSVVAKNGYKKETLETLQTTEFLEAFHNLLGRKGYELPKELVFAENRIPRLSGIAGESFSRLLIYNPRCINSLDFRIPIHETGHLMRHIPNISFKMGVDSYLYTIGENLKKIPFVKNLFKEHMLCHLSKEEQLALKSDYARAYKEGFFKNNPVHVLSKEIVANTKNSKKAEHIKRLRNQLAKDFRKEPEKFYLPNSQLNREEFIADYFNLAAQGFEFSPIVTKKYMKYGGPKIGEVITKEDFESLAKLKKSISKKTLADYGYSWEG